MLFQMRFRTLFTLLLSLIAPAGSASTDMRFNFENCYSKVRNETQYSRTLNAAVKSAEPYTLVSLHNRGTNIPPSGADFGSAGEKKYAFGIVACHDGTVYKYSTRNARPFAVSVIDKKVDIYMAPPYNMGVIDAFQRALQDAQEAYGIEWSEIK